MGKNYKVSNPILIPKLNFGHKYTSFHRKFHTDFSDNISIFATKQATSFTVFPHIRFADIIILCSLQMRILLENTTFLLHKVIRIEGIIRDAGII